MTDEKAPLTIAMERLAQIPKPPPDPPPAPLRKPNGEPADEPEERPPVPPPRPPYEIPPEPPPPARVSGAVSFRSSPASPAGLAEGSRSRWPPAKQRQIRHKIPTSIWLGPPPALLRDHSGLGRQM